jgi:hypothetical protein
MYSEVELGIGLRAEDLHRHANADFAFKEEELYSRIQATTTTPITNLFFPH